ncbi:MAG: hypothetical protein AABY51_06515 [Deltaproteobacteria bacterium]
MSQDDESKRKELLLKMYDQLFNDINRHILVVWQSVGLLFGAFAVFALVEKKIMPLYVASSLIVLLTAWLLAHIYDAAYWYNRNIVIIGNIERQFLKKEDLTNIHHYFKKHRSENEMITHLQIQYYLGIGIALLVIIYHFYVEIMPGICAPWGGFESQQTLPYILIVSATICLSKLKKEREEKYKEFLKKSPGIQV